jgi:Ca2+-binding RTX toxin-like protein
MSRISLRHLFSRVARRPATPRTTLHVEALEGRRNPVSGVSAVYNFGTATLEITGVAPGNPTFNANDRLWLLRFGNQVGLFDVRANHFVPIQNDPDISDGNDSINTAFLTGGIAFNGGGTVPSGGDLLDANSAGKRINGIQYEAITNIPITITGGAGADSLAGSDGNDTIFGQTGPDQIFGNSGDDSIIAGDGADRVFGDDRGTLKVGQDTILGGQGNDNLHGGPDNDSILGGSNNDTIFGDNGEDDLLGEAYNDRISVGTGLGGSDWFD